MYQVVVATFGTLCERTSSFAHFEWRLWSHNIQQNDPNQSGNALSLAIAIEELGTAYENFCKHCVLGLLSTFFENLLILNRRTRAVNRTRRSFPLLYYRGCQKGSKGLGIGSFRKTAMVSFKGAGILLCINSWGRGRGKGGEGCASFSRRALYWEKPRDPERFHPQSRLN
jgi:hypothetical protein